MFDKTKEIDPEINRIEYLKKMEDIITEVGYFIQGVRVPRDSESGYAYTIGRSDQGKPDLFMRINSWSEANIINKVVKALDNAEVVINTPSTVPGWRSAHDGTPTKFVVTDMSGYYSEEEEVLGVYSRDQRMGRETIPLLTIVLGNNVNQLPYPWNTN